MTSRTEDGFIDLMDPDNFVDRMPWEELDRLRKTHPVYWHPEEGRDGFWVVTRFEDVVQVSRHPEIFSSYEDGALLLKREGTEEERQESLEQQRLMMLNMDPPEHTKLRALVQRAFTPRTINRLEERLRKITANIIDRAIEQGEGNFVEDVAAELPLEAIAELMGVPREDRRKIFDWSNRLVGGDDPEFHVAETETREAATEMFMYANAMAEEKKSCPADDLVSKLLTAEVDGDQLSEMEFDMFFMLLAVAGNETTRNAISHGLLAFHDHPEQWELFKRERPSATMAEEVVRWATPVMHFQRTALQDTELGGQPIKQGERVAINYASANRDPEIFDDPYSFDITRDPNPHIGFGGGGPHFCLGANLARMEIEIMFETIADRIPNIELTGEPRRLRSMFLNAIKDIPVRYVT
jgi:cholest-4-en-3-one 26-monooxygenase